MEAGLLGNLRIGAIIQARMNSTRLPGKVMMGLPFPTGKPLILRVIENVSSLSFIDAIIVATSIDSSNDSMCQLLEDHGHKYFRGDEADVLSRFIAITEKAKLDVVIRLTADNPFLDIPSLKETIKDHVERNSTYTITKGLPLGMNMELIDGKRLCELAEMEDLTDEDKEHVTYYFERNKRYEVNYKSFSIEPQLSKLRTTIDYPSDLALSSLILNSLKSPSITELSQLLKSQPWLAGVNKEAYQKKVYESVDLELAASAELLDNYELSASAEILRSARLAK